MGVALPRERVVRYRLGLRVWADPSDIVERPAWLFGTYEPDVADIFERTLRTGDVALDIGAHAGLHTVVLAAMVGVTGRVVAFEPNPRSVRRLRRNIELNGFGDSVLIWEIAASDAEGVGTLHLSDDQANSGGASLGGQRVPTSSIDVQRRRIDACVPADLASRVRVAKIDVEGHEPAVLAGATGVLSAQPAVVFEHNTLAVPAALRADGYRIYGPLRLNEPLVEVDAANDCQPPLPGAGVNMVAVVPGSVAAIRLGLSTASH